MVFVAKNILRSDLRVYHFKIFSWWERASVSLADVTHTLNVPMLCPSNLLDLAMPLIILTCFYIWYTFWHGTNQHCILRMSKSRWNLLSIHTLIPPQATFNYKWHLHSPEHSTAMAQCSKTDQLRRGATIIIGPSKQDICPVQITWKVVPTPQDACRQIRCNFWLRDSSQLTRPRLQAIIRNTLH